MRDQRHLESLKKVSRKTKLILRNHLTKRYPALPLPNTHSSTQDGEEKGKVSRDQELEQLDLGERLDSLGESLRVQLKSADSQDFITFFSRHTVRPGPFKTDAKMAGGFG